MSFVTADDIINVVETLLLSIERPDYWMKGLNYNVIPNGLKTFPRMSYTEAMEKYGTDKPDLRFDLLINEWTEASVDGYKACISTDRSSVNEIEGIVKELPPIDFVSVEKVANDFIKLVVSSKRKIQTLRYLGRMRTLLGEKIASRDASYLRSGAHFVWIEEFPLFEMNEMSDKLQSVHHPFTAPTEATLEYLRTDPLKVHGQHFDLVCNGNEIGGGSIRIHDSQLQHYIIADVLKEDPIFFKHMLRALKMGTPPHGGIALGIDRLIALLLGFRTIHDVIAFPKSNSGRDLLSSSPSVIDEHLLKKFHIRVR